MRCFQFESRAPRPGNGLLLECEAQAPAGAVHQRLSCMRRAQQQRELGKNHFMSGWFKSFSFQASTMSPMLSYLQIQLAQAMNQQNLQQVSYVSELQRCLNSLDSSAHYKLIEELQKDLLQRQSYLQYLVRLRQDLLSTIATIDNFQKRLQNDRIMCNRHLVMVCVRMFLEKREAMINAFQQEFNKKPAADEKLELMEELIGSLMEDLKNDSIVQGMADWQLFEARNCIERILLQRLYHQVMFPNDDVDISNDR